MFYKVSGMAFHELEETKEETDYAQAIDGAAITIIK